jgi:hypothetical protein
MRKKYISIQFLNTRAKLLTTRGPNLRYRNIFLSHWIQSLHIMFYSLSEKTNTINLLLKNNNI